MRFAAAIADPEAHRATAQLLPISHVYIYESSVSMKVREALVPPPSLAKFPPISQASYIGEGLPSPSRGRRRSAKSLDGAFYLPRRRGYCEAMGESESRSIAQLSPSCFVFHG
jgi:hypothetical protein